MRKLVLVIIAMILLASVGWAGDNETLELKQTQMQLIEARQGQSKGRA